MPDQRFLRLKRGQFKVVGTQVEPNGDVLYKLWRVVYGEFARGYPVLGYKVLSHFYKIVNKRDGVFSFMKCHQKIEEGV